MTRVLRDLAAVPRAIADLAIARRERADAFRHALASGRSVAGATGPRADSRARAIARSIGIAARIVPWSPDCVERAMAARRALTRHGIGFELVHGARPDGGGVEAHVWIVCGGRVVTGGDMASHAHFRSSDSAGRVS